MEQVLAWPLSKGKWEVQGINMWHIRSEDIKLKETSSGELFTVLLGRHESKGASKQHTVAMVEVPPGKKSSPHYHKEREESYYFLEGEGLARIESKEAKVKKGDLVFSRPGQKHEFINSSNSPMKYLVITSPLWVPEDSHT